MLNLLWVIAGIFLVLWVLGFAFSVTMGGLIHLLLALAIISIVLRLVLGRRVTG